MRPLRLRVFLATTAVLIFSPAHGQNYNELKAMVDGPWHHLPNPVSSLQFNRDEARCRVVAAQTPVDSTTPAIVEIAHWRVMINCLKARGYEPGTAPAGKPVGNFNRLTELRYADYSCAEIAKMRTSSPDVDAIFFIWMRGFIDGWNAAHEKDDVFKVDAAAIPLDEQVKIVRKFCDEHPTTIYFGAAMDLLVRLKKVAN
jgi:hypothetical protein